MPDFILAIMHLRLSSVRSTVWFVAVAALLGCEAFQNVGDHDENCLSDNVQPPRDLLSTDQGDLEFDTIDATLNHRQGEGCLNAVELVFRRANHPGCTLMATASNSMNSEGYLELKSLNLRASSTCPGFPDKVEGTYVDDDLGDSGIEVLGKAEGEYLGCYKAGLVLHLDGSLERSAGESGVSELELLSTRMNVMGSMSSLGDDESCPSG